MKRIIFIGQTGSGKTTLSQKIRNEEIKYHKTQQVYIDEEVIDTPGEFMENKFYYNALVAAAQGADYIGLVQTVDGEQNYFPPLFSSRFTKPVVGIITKIDLCEDDKKITLARKRLKLAGAKRIFEVSTIEDEGVEDLLTFLA